MNDRPTSGPTQASIAQKERAAISSRHSLRNSQTTGLPRQSGERSERLATAGLSRKRKEDLLEIDGRRARSARWGERGKLLDRAFAAHAAAAQEHKAVAHTRSF